MKEIKLLELSIKNFKGIKDFTLSANGESLKVYGENGTGKTTLFDAFMWLLFSKDSNNRTDFEIKPLDKNGNVSKHGLSHEVEGIFEIDGSTTELKKVFSEKWTKKRGSSKETFTGHTTDYYIDGVPSKKKDFDDTVGSMISEDVFKLLTNPAYFNQQLDWKKRREILFEIAGDVTDQEVSDASNNEDLKALINRLNGRDIEDHIKIIKSRQREVNKELDRIPIRMDEIDLSIPEISELNEESLQFQLEDLTKRIEEKQVKIGDIRSGSEISNKRKELSDIQLEIAAIRNELNEQKTNELYSLNARVQEEESNINIMKSKIELKKEQMKSNLVRVEQLKKDLERFRYDWIQVDDREFLYAGDSNCPTCGQELPTNQIEEARKKAISQFNLKKAEDLKAITDKGVGAKDQLESIQKVHEKLDREMEEMEKEIFKKHKSIKKLKEDMEALHNSIMSIAENPQYLAKMKEKDEIEYSILRMKDSTEEAVGLVKSEIAKLEDAQFQVKSDLNKIQMFKQYQKRIKELEQMERDLTSEYEKLEHELFLTEEFTRQKVDLLEEKINRKFRYARFKLFKQNINGGIEPTCITTFNGVPYDKGLNNAARINIGIDIIRTLQEYYEIRVPLFVDNREAVVDLLEIEAQTISLIVSEVDSDLRIEVKGA